MAGGLAVYQISIRQHFDAAHFLRGYRGKCEALHGHRYEVVAKINAPALDEIGLAYDFTLIKKELAAVLAPLDHSCLNDNAAFKEVNPSAENIAALIYHGLSPRIAAPAALVAVEVWESPEQGVAYSPD